MSLYYSSASSCPPRAHRSLHKKKIIVNSLHRGISACDSFECFLTTNTVMDPFLFSVAAPQVCGLFHRIQKPKHLTQGIKQHDI